MIMTYDQIAQVAISTVSEILDIPESVIKSKTRTPDLAMARFMVIDILHNRIKMSSKMVGNYLNGRDHSTVLAGAKRHNDLMMVDPEYNNKFHKVLIRANQLGLDINLA